MAAPVDPDAALHAAQPGKFKPASADAPAAPSEPGTLSDAVERLPNYAPVKATQAPIEQEQSWGDWLGSGWGGASGTFHAAEVAGRNDRGDFSSIAMRDGYAPLLDTLGIDRTQNPVLFNDSGIVKPPSTLYRQRNPNAGYFDYSNVSQAAQEQLIADVIRERRATDPKLLPGVPDTVEGLHAYFIANEKKKRDQASASIAAQPRGLGTDLASLGGSLTEAMKDPFNAATLPIGGGGKTILGVVAREALVNGIVSAVQQPLVAQNREMFGEHLTAGEAATNIGLGAAGGGILGGALHGVGKAIEATGLPQKLASTVGNLDIANTVSYKIYSALPEPMQRKWGAGIVTKWAHRLAAGEKLEDVFSNLSNVELATLSKAVIGTDRLTPEERAAAEHLTRTEEVGASSPYEPGATGDGTHEDKLATALDSIINNRPVEEVPSAPRPSDPGAAGASPTAEPARPPAALSTARRPLSPALEAARLPADIYDGLKARGIPDHLARGIAAGTFAESRGKIDALGPVTRATHGDQAFGIGQWLGPRKAELFKRYGPSPSLEQQLDFLVYELKGGDAGGKSVLGAKDEVDALHRYIKDFMRPGEGPETTKDLGRGMAALGRGGEPLPEGELAGAGGSADVGPDPDIARLREEALKLDDAVIGAPASPVPPMYARSFRTDELTVDAARFQFKGGADDLGVTDRLRGIKEWNPMYAGRVVAWEDAGGRVFLADGHQRFGLARRLESEGHPPIGLDALVLREADGVSADDARVYGALKNIAEGTGSMVDAAKVIRGAGDHLLAHLPPKSALVRDARALASLSDEAFGAVYNDVLPADYAAVIGHLLPDRPEAHGAMVDLLVKTDPANRGQAESIVRQGIAAGMHKAEQVDLFGEREVMQSLMLERAKVLEKGLAQLRKSKLLFKTAAKEADRLEAVGSKIAKSASEKEAQANAQALELVSRLAFTHGPIADALNEASRKLAAGAKLGDVADEFAAAVKRTDLGTLAREAANDDANRLVPDGAGRGGDAAEAGEAIHEEQPSLTDLERATERFSDPDGPAVKQQAESLEHDFIQSVAWEPLDRDALEAEDPEYLALQDAADIIQHAVDNHAISIGRELGFPDDEAFHEELAKLLRASSNEDGAAIGLKHVEKAIKEGRLKLDDHGAPDLPEPKPLSPSTLVPEPERSIKAADYAGEFIAPEEAAARVASWKAEAKRIGKESPPPENHVILSLFDASGVWSKPYREMGYHVIQLDAKHGVDVIGDISHIQLKIDELRAQGYHFAGVLAQPPCTTFAASGARWWEPRHNRKWQNAMRKMFGAEAVKLFETPVEYNQFLVLTAEEFISRAKPDFFTIENPVGRIEKMAGLPKPLLTIEPHHFGDAYTKKTNLWGKFNPELPTANVDPVEGSRAHNLRGRDEKDDGLRSLTPEGFAYAFALANRPGTEGAERAVAKAAPSSSAIDPAARREQIRAATAALESTAPGEFRTIEPFPEQEPGYHRFRYVAKDGTAVGGNYTLDNGPPPFLEGFNVGDTNNPKKLGAAEVRAMFAEIRRQHPEATRIHAFRMTGARTATGDGAKEIWIDLAGKGDGVKPEDVDVRAGEATVDEPAPLDLGEKVDPAIADRERQQVELKAAAPLQSLHEQLGTMGLKLFDAHDQPTLDLHEEAKSLLEELNADDKAIKALKDCL